MTVPDAKLRRAPLAPGSLLVALPHLLDPSFRQTVVLLCHVDDEGAMGLIVNRPTGMPLGAALPDDELIADRREPLFEGGPVATDRIVILRRGGGQPPDFTPVFDGVALGDTLPALKDAATAAGIVGSYRPYVGHAGWGPGQLQGELDEKSWALLPPDADVVFAEHPRLAWSRCMTRLGGPFAIYATMPADIHMN